MNEQFKLFEHAVRDEADKRLSGLDREQDSRRNALIRANKAHKTQSNKVYQGRQDKAHSDKAYKQKSICGSCPNHRNKERATMLVKRPSATIVNEPDIFRQMEYAGRVCTNTLHRMDENKALDFVTKGRRQENSAFLSMQASMSQMRCRSLICSTKIRLNSAL